MYLVDSIFKNGLTKAHVYFHRADVYVKTLEYIIKYRGLYPNQNEYIDFAIEYEFRKPISQLLKMTEEKS